MTFIGKSIKAITFPSKFELFGNRLIQNGERVRMEYAGKELQRNTKIAKIVQELGLKKPKVLVGVNGRGNSAVAGITVKDGNKVVLRAAGGVDYRFGEKPIVQIRSRVADGQPARLNVIADLNKQVNAENMAASMSSKGGKLDVSLDSDMVKGNFKADMNSGEMRIPSVKFAYDKLMGEVTGMINGNKGIQVGTEKISDSLNRVKNPWKNTFCKEATDIAKTEVNLGKKEVPDDLKQFAKDLRKKGEEIRDAAKEAEYIKWKEKLSDEDCEFIAKKAKELGTTVFDRKLLEDPEIIKRFGLQ